MPSCTFYLIPTFKDNSHCSRVLSLWWRIWNRDIFIKLPTHLTKCILKLPTHLTKCILKLPVHLHSQGDVSMVVTTPVEQVSLTTFDLLHEASNWQVIYNLKLLPRCVARTSQWCSPFCEYWNTKRFKFGVLSKFPVWHHRVTYVIDTFTLFMMVVGG